MHQATQAQAAMHNARTLNEKVVAQKLSSVIGEDKTVGVDLRTGAR